MKESEIREALSKFDTNSTIPQVAVAYAAGFPSGVYMYAAPVPEEWQHADQQWPIKPLPALPEDIILPTKVNPIKVNKCELDELIDAILALKAESSEIYKLKALACALRESTQMESDD